MTCKYSFASTTFVVAIGSLFIAVAALVHSCESPSIQTIGEPEERWKTGPSFEQAIDHLARKCGVDFGDQTDVNPAY